MAVMEGRASRPQSAIRGPSTSEPPPPFHLYAGSEPEGRVRGEIVNSLAAKTKSMYTHQSLVADVYVRLRRAASGALVDGDERVPVRRDPDLWEVRWNLRRYGQFRLYYAEKTAEPRFVGLRFHEKVVLSSEQATVNRQDQEMDLASQRHAQGAGRAWGHTPKPCKDCVDP